MNIDISVKRAGILSGHKACITKILFSNDENYILSSSLDNKICLWNVNTHLHINTYKDVHKKGINDIALFKDNSKFFSAGNDAYVYLWDTLSNRILNRVNVNDKVNVAKLSKNEKLLFCSKNNSVNIYDFRERDFKKKNRPLQVFSDAKDLISDIFLDEFEIYSCSIDNSLRLYDLRMGKMMSYDMKSSILSMDLTNDRNYVGVNLIDNSIKLIEKNSGTVLGLYKGDMNNNHRRNIKFDNKNKFILSCSYKNELLIYDIVNSNIINSTTFYNDLEFEEDLDIYKNTYYILPIGKPTYYLNINKHILTENAYIDRDKYNSILNKYKHYGKKVSTHSSDADFQNVNNKIVCGDIDGDIHVLQLYYM
ncbi:mitogen-activated protein kinase organizer 1 [Plasmodium brasilianum]|uniref:Mitogen-activated protein kinase organizer 1, putative n=3 Tax=Plasmodium (Plasmodium) TaxID=418103 RepID=A0A1D3JKJ6_PLAMA|nr:mitogen-activated protein kinase organizer 1, putative [Plasmodium malariae]KAI4841301.1 mitogen-activated protein kinase organizer 1 [Plasmodium brasilianum]SBT86991.1 mitogen-activated protein kinase organizer 1, putative [Plasmodium malariae]